MVDQELAVFVKVFLVIVGALLPIVNPIGSAPLFLALTRGADSGTRNLLAASVAVNSFLLLMGSLILGNFVLRLFGLSIPVVQLAGGLVLCLLGGRMLSDDTPTIPEVNTADDERAIARAFYPLTLPLTVDPGAISVAVTIGANHPHDLRTLLMGIVGSVAGVTTIAVSVWLSYRYAERVSRWLGHSRMMAVLRLSAFVMLCIGVQIAWNGVKGLLEEVRFTTANEPAATNPSGSNAAPVHPLGAAPTNR